MEGIGSITEREYSRRRLRLYADLYQRCGQMPLHSLEALARKIHAIDIKIRSFRGGLYDKM